MKELKFIIIIQKDLKLQIVVFMSLVTTSDGDS